MASDYSTALVQIKPLGSNTWTPLPTPSDYKMTSTTLVDSARNANGIVVASVIREGIRKIEMTWKYLTQAQFSLIAKLFEGAKTGGVGGFFVDVFYYDTIRGQYVQSNNEYADKDNTITRKFYVGDRVSDTAKVKLNGSNVAGYENVRLSLIEC